MLLVPIPILEEQWLKCLLNQNTGTPIPTTLLHPDTGIPTLQDLIQPISLLFQQDIYTKGKAVGHPDGIHTVEILLIIITTFMLEQVLQPMPIFGPVLQEKVDKLIIVKPELNWQQG